MWQLGKRFERRDRAILGEGLEVVEVSQTASLDYDDGHCAPSREVVTVELANGSSPLSISVTNALGNLQTQDGARICSGETVVLYGISSSDGRIGGQGLVLRVGCALAHRGPGYSDLKGVDGNLAVKLFTGAHAERSSEREYGVLSKFVASGVTPLVFLRGQLKEGFGSWQAGTWCLLETFVGEMSLDDYMKRNNERTMEDALAVASAVVRLLGSSSDLGFVHGDLKPSNLRITPNEDGSIGEVWVVDFGAASDAMGSASGAHTDGWAAPERASDPSSSEASHPKVDVWSMAAIMQSVVNDGPPAPPSKIKNRVGQARHRDEGGQVLTQRILDDIVVSHGILESDFVREKIKGVLVQTRREMDQAILLKMYQCLQQDQVSRPDAGDLRLVFRSPSDYEAALAASAKLALFSPMTSPNEWPAAVVSSLDSVSTGPGRAPSQESVLGQTNGLYKVVVPLNQAADGFLALWAAGNPADVEKLKTHLLQRHLVVSLFGRYTSIREYVEDKCQSVLDRIDDSFVFSSVPAISSCEVARAVRDNVLNGSQAEGEDLSEPLASYVKGLKMLICWEQEGCGGEPVLHTAGQTYVSDAVSEFWKEIFESRPEGVREDTWNGAREEILSGNRSRMYDALDLKGDLDPERMQCKDAIDYGYNYLIAVNCLAGSEDFAKSLLHFDKAREIRSGSLAHPVRYMNVRGENDLFMFTQNPFVEQG